MYSYKKLEFLLNGVFGLFYPVSSWISGYGSRIFSLQPSAYAVRSFKKERPEFQQRENPNMQLLIIVERNKYYIGNLGTIYRIRTSKSYPDPDKSRPDPQH